MIDKKLPDILVITLEKLLDERILSSWNITGGHIYTQITLRFSNSGQADDENDVKYRRISPSQLKRDRLRAMKASHVQQCDSLKHDKDRQSCSVAKNIDNDISSRITDVTTNMFTFTHSAILLYPRPPQLLLGHHNAMLVM